MKQLIFAGIALILLSSCKKKENDDVVEAVNYYDVSYGSNSAQKMDVYLPGERSIEETKVLIYIHGGGWVQGDKSEFNGLLPYFQSRMPDYAFISVNYRLCDTTTFQNQFPTQENDIILAVNYIKGKLAEWKLSNKVVICGASAGGHLSLLHGLKNNSDGLIKASIAYFPPTELDSLYSYSDFTTNLLNVVMDGSPTQQQALYANSSPANYVTSSSIPVQVFHGEADVIVPVSQTYLLQNRLTQYNVANSIHVYSGEGHGFSYNVTLETIEHLEFFLSQHNP